MQITSRLIFILLLLEQLMCAQKAMLTDKQLTARLDTIYHDDLDYRKQDAEIGQKYGWQSEERQAHRNTIRQKDSINQAKVARILDEQGWLGISRVGSQGSRALFLVIQHAPLAFQEKYLPLMREAAKKNQAGKADLAWLEDRVLVQRGKKQLYGTQIGTDMETGEEYVKPIEEPEHVDERRATMGLAKMKDFLRQEGMSWETYLQQQLGIQAKPDVEITDTVRLVVLSPNKVIVQDNIAAEYNKFSKELLEKRKGYKEQKLQERNGHMAEYQAQPAHLKRMADNELNFYDSLTIDNYISMVVRGYMAYRLYEPLGVERRLVFVISKKSGSNIKEYAKISGKNKNSFIINFPVITVYKEQGQLAVRAQTELYSGGENKILLASEHVGLNKREMTDFPMCFENGWDCAFVNSVYPSLIPFLEAIIGREVDE